MRNDDENDEDSRLQTNIIVIKDQLYINSIKKALHQTEIEREKKCLESKSQVPFSFFSIMRFNCLVHCSFRDRDTHNNRSQEKNPTLMMSKRKTASSSFPASTTNAIISSRQKGISKS